MEREDVKQLSAENKMKAKDKKEDKEIIDKIISENAEALKELAK